MTVQVWVPAPREPDTTHLSSLENLGKCLDHVNNNQEIASCDSKRNGFWYLVSLDSDSCVYMFDIIMVVTVDEPDDSPWKVICADVEHGM
jgi:hypothetical protein